MIKYLKNHTSKLALSRKFADGLLQDVVIRLDTFRSSMKEQFDDPLAEHLSDASQEIKDHYIELLNKSIEGQYYFGDKMDFRQIASGMKIWRIPVSKKYNKYQQYRHIYIKMKYIHTTSMPYAWIGHPDRSKESGDGSDSKNHVMILNCCLDTKANPVHQITWFSNYIRVPQLTLIALRFCKNIVRNDVCMINTGLLCLHT